MGSDVGTGHMRSAFLLGAVIAVLLLALPPAAGAQGEQDTETIEVPAEMDWRIYQRSESSCTSYGFVVWEEQPGAVAWDFHYIFDGEERSKPLSPPFSDDAFNEEPRFWTPPEGHHWFAQSKYSKSSPGRPADCSEGQANQIALYGRVWLMITVEKDARIVGQVKDPAGEAVEGVKVSAKGAGSARTDEAGEYEIDVPEETRTYKVVPKDPGSEFKPKNRKVKVRPGQIKTADFKVKGKVISGRAMMSCKNTEGCSVGPVENVKIKAKPTGKRGGRAKTTFTDTDGRYTLIVGSGPYKLTSDLGKLEIKPKQKKVPKKGSKATVNFKACGVSGKPGARWFGSDCLNNVGMEWSGGAFGPPVIEDWTAVSVCTPIAPGPFDVYYRKPEKVMSNRTIAGESTTVKASRVDFDSDDPNVSGFLDAGKGAGEFDGAETLGTCFATAAGVNMKG